MSATPTTVYGYYPYVTGTTTAPAAIPIDLSNQTQTGITGAGSFTHLASNDYMAATPVTQTFSATGNQSLSLAFNPLLTILSFEIKAPEAMTVSSIKLEAVGTTNTTPFYTAGTVDITTADKTFPITNTGTATNTITLNVSNGAIAAKATGMFNMMIFPIEQGKMPSKFKVTITTTDGKSYVQTKTAPTNGFVRGGRSIMKLDALKLAPVDEMTFTINFTNAPDPTDKTFIIPFTTQGTTPCDLVIEWGDGESKSIPNGTDLSIQATADLLKHTYTASAAEYQITITTVAPATQQQMPKLGFHFRTAQDNNLKLKSMDSPMLNTGSTDLSHCFFECSNLTSISATLFEKNTNATIFRNCFMNCSGLTGEIPATLFKDNTNVTTFSGCFMNCSGLTSIPKLLFEKNTVATSFTNCFKGCTKATLNANIFCTESTESDTRFLNQTVNFNNCFKGCGSDGSVTNGGTAPALWTYTFGTGTPIKIGCFNNVTKVTNVGVIDNAWK